MRYRAILAVTAAALTGLTTMAGATVAGAAPSQAGQLHSARVCAVPTAGAAGCMSKVRTDANGKPIATLTPSGYQDSGHSALVLVRSGPGFDLVAQGEVGARVERVCGGEVLTQLGDRGGGAPGW